MVGLRKQRCQQLRKKLTEYKKLFLEAIQANTVQAYDEVLKKAEKLPFQIHAHTICIENREKLLKPVAPPVEVVVPPAVKQEFVPQPGEVVPAPAAVAVAGPVPDPASVTVPAVAGSVTEQKQEQVEQAAAKAPEISPEEVARRKAEEDARALRLQQQEQAAGNNSLRDVVVAELKKALDGSVEDAEVKAGIAKAKEVGLHEKEEGKALIADCEKMLSKKEAERELIHKLTTVLMTPAIHSPHEPMNADVAIKPVEELMCSAKLEKSFYPKELDKLTQDVSLLLDLRRAYVARDAEGVDKIMQARPAEVEGLKGNEEVGLMRKFVDITRECRVLIEKMRAAIVAKNRDRIMDLLAQGKVLRIQWDPELFKQAMDTLKKQSEIAYYKEKARETKSIGLIQLAIQKAEENNPADPDIKELQQLKNSIKEVVEECLVALNVLERSQMEAVLNKAKALEISNDLIDTLQMLLYEMDDDSFEELQFKVALKLDDKKLFLKRMILKKKREVMNVPKAEEVFSMERCPILQDVETWARKSFLSDLFGVEERRKTFLVWTNKRIHKPLSKISDKKQQEEAVEIFKNILCFMGDMEHKAPVSCAQSIIHSGIHNALIRDEIYLQLMKQLRGNPSEASVSRGWILTAYCLKSFAPAVTQNQVDYFIRSKAKCPEQLLMIMYTKILFEQNNFMQLNEIRTMLAYSMRE